MPNDEQLQPPPDPDSGNAGGSGSEHSGIGEVQEGGFSSGIPVPLPDYGEARQSEDMPLSVRPDERDEIIVDTSRGDTAETGDVEQGGGD